MGITYKNSGVNIDKGKSFVKKIAQIAKSTFTNRVITDIGDFSALFSASFPDMKDPILVSSTDGVGTKIKIAQMMNFHETIGIDAVAMCVNDVITSGAQPLFFLDYISCGKLNESTLIQVVKGIAEGCLTAGCSLIGGETAEHPNLMESDNYDIAGFSVGIVDREKIINPKEISKGDFIIGLKSSGIHSNGYSLVRKILFEVKKYNTNTFIPDFSDTIGKALLIPTKIYCKSVMNCINNGIKVKGIVHITGGGFYENIPRILPEGVSAKIDRSSFDIPTIFNFIQREGNIDNREMFTTFNMGIGLMLIIEKEYESKTIETLQKVGESPIIIGEIVDCSNERVMIL